MRRALLILSVVVGALAMTTSPPVHHGDSPAYGVAHAKAVKQLETPPHGGGEEMEEPITNNPYCSTLGVGCLSTCWVADPACRSTMCIYDGCIPTVSAPTCHIESPCCSSEYTMCALPVCQAPQVQGTTWGVVKTQ